MFYTKYPWECPPQGESKDYTYIIDVIRLHLEFIISIGGTNGNITETADSRISVGLSTSSRRWSQIE